MVLVMTIILMVAQMDMYMVLSIYHITQTYTLLPEETAEKIELLLLEELTEVEQAAKTILPVYQDIVVVAEDILPLQLALQLLILLI